MTLGIMAHSMTIKITSLSIPSFDAYAECPSEQFISFLTYKGPNKLECYTGLERLARDKHTSLLRQFIS